MRSIAVVNQKGGCGKTITSINLSAFLALAGRRVLLVDMDPQGHSTLGLAARAPDPTRTMYDVFLAEMGRSTVTLTDIIRRVDLDLDLAPSDIRLSAIPEALAGVAGREYLLTRMLASVDQEYDYVIIDCPPTVGLLTFNALMACSEALVPMEPSFFSLHGVGKLFETFQVLERETGHRIEPRVVVTQFAGRSPFVKSILDEVRQHLAGLHYETVIGHSVKLAEAASHGVPITRYAPQAAGFRDYEALAREVLQREPAPAQPAPREEAAAASAPVISGDSVVFSIEAPLAERVQLAGDFNGWRPDTLELRRVGDVWKTSLTLEPGRYRYRFVVDGHWQRDPLNEAIEPSPYGGYDSLVVLEGDDRPEWVVSRSHENGHH
jgi:chromosome partitioning protein